MKGFFIGIIILVASAQVGLSVVETVETVQTMAAKRLSDMGE